MGPDRKMDDDSDASDPSLVLPVPQTMDAIDGDSSDDASDSEVQEGPQADGYMLLPDGDEDVEQDDAQPMDEGSNPSNKPNLPAHLARLVPGATPLPDQSTSVSFVDSVESRQERRKIMAADEDIRKAMAGFSLSGMAVPSWASALAEDEWQEQLSAMIQGRDEQSGQASNDNKS